jgi:hypothetical protein
MIDNNENVPRIITKYPNVEYFFVFKNVFDKFIDKNARDIMYRIIHEVLPVNYLTTLGYFVIIRGTFSLLSIISIKELYNILVEILPNTKSFLSE